MSCIFRSHNSLYLQLLRLIPLVFLGPVAASLITLSVCLLSSPFSLFSYPLLSHHLSPCLASFRATPFLNPPVCPSPIPCLFLLRLLLSVRCLCSACHLSGHCLLRLFPSFISRLLPLMLAFRHHQGRPASDHHRAQRRRQNCKFTQTPQTATTAFPEPLSNVCVYWRRVAGLLGLAGRGEAGCGGWPFISMP